MHKQLLFIQKHDEIFKQKEKKIVRNQLFVSPPHAAQSAAVRRGMKSNTF